MEKYIKNLSDFINEEVFIADPKLDWQDFGLKPIFSGVKINNSEVDWTDEYGSIDLFMSDGKIIRFAIPLKKEKARGDLEIGLKEKVSFIIDGDYFIKLVNQLGLTGAVVSCLIGLIYRDWSPTKNIWYNALDMSKVTIR